MAKLVWDQMAEKFFEGGTSKGVCYTGYDKNSDKYTVGQAWNGISGFTDNPSGADEQASYADNIKYISMRGAENYGGTIKCFWYPENFRGCLGKKNPVASDSSVVKGVTVSQQGRETFGFAVTTQVGNDTDGTEAGETIHLVWNAMTSPSSKDYSSLNESPSPSELSFEFAANPVAVGDGSKFKATANMEICTAGLDTTVDADFFTNLAKLKYILYGGEPTYDLLTSKPSDWETKYTTYFTRTGTGTSADPYVYAANTTSTWATDTFYKMTADGNPYLPSPGAIIELFGGVINTVPEG